MHFKLVLSDNMVRNVKPIWMLSIITQSSAGFQSEKCSVLCTLCPIVSFLMDRQLVENIVWVNSNTLFYL
jgi:hypothetical protein